MANTRLGEFVPWDQVTYGPDGRALIRMEKPEPKHQVGDRVRLKNNPGAGTFEIRNATLVEVFHLDFERDATILCPRWHYLLNDGKGWVPESNIAPTFAERLAQWNERRKT